MLMGSPRMRHSPVSNCGGLAEAMKDQNRLVFDAISSCQPSSGSKMNDRTIQLIVEGLTASCARRCDAPQRERLSSNTKIDSRI